MACIVTDLGNHDRNRSMTLGQLCGEKGRGESMNGPDCTQLMWSVDPYAGYGEWHELSKSMVLNRSFQPLRHVCVAVLATYTTDLLLPLLSLAAARHRLSLEVIETPFGQLEQMLFNDSCGFRAMPEYLVLAGTWHELGLIPGEPTDEAVREAVKRWTGLWDAAIAGGARVVQVGFVPPAVDSFGMAASGEDSSISAAVARINTELAKNAVGRVVFADAAAAASIVGLRNWDSPRYWHSARLPCCMDALPHMAALIAGAIAADCGLTARCVIVDLDNTLWGGILGEDGVDGIAIGNGPLGESFASFQHYLRSLRQRGIALAVASKNDPMLVEEVFNRNPRMVLRREDFACIVASWQRKSEQVLDISRRLHLGLSSLIFVDDNPAERAEVAQALPEVQVIEMPRSPASYPDALASAPGLFYVQHSHDDGLRGHSYSGLRQATELAEQMSSRNEFLHSLGMSAEVRPLNQNSLPRAAQLIAKTNQFNLTVRRRTQSELERLMHDPSVLALTLALRDRFADHGIVGFCLAFTEGTDALIDTLLLSCRVIGRTAERILVAEAAKWAAQRGCASLLGIYRPTDRNRMV